MLNAYLMLTSIWFNTIIKKTDECGSPWVLLKTGSCYGGSTIPDLYFGMRFPFEPVMKNKGRKGSEEEEFLKPRAAAVHLRISYPTIMQWIYAHKNPKHTDTGRSPQNSGK
jgi:hypothetical protein